MTRTYQSRRRTEDAERTRQAIVEAAVKLHGMGITTLSAVAEEAGVSLPTVNKHFPTREDLFVACTGHVAAMLDYPSMEALAAIADHDERVAAVVSEAYRLNEATFGQTWTGLRLEDESPVLARAIQNTEQVQRTLAATMLHDWDVKDKPAVTAYVEALLHPLTYRALRLKSGLSQADAVRYTAQALSGLLRSR